MRLNRYFLSHTKNIKDALISLSTVSSTIILGIDPGSLKTGYGLIESSGNRLRFLECGTIKTGGGPLPPRLKIIFNDIRKVVQHWSPDEMAIENVFLARNPDSALKLGQARGAAICAVMAEDIPVAEYTANQVKQAIVGKGHAAKTQVQHMVKVLLNLSETPQSDAADALAIALCHANTNKTMTELKSKASERYPAEVLGAIRGRRKKRFTL
ncbi:MAG: crossover junction endodeoxyribonuclease RuvC [gamma proteobacterium symbiont of Lucinoma myriamae]|nr:crossover junction endodeoxyribonuclease RuvC [gamma proteobacterium symbiont of Lucinoma myriamae]MCU7820054.1 crossover junction endodeoxyribonuclease RuvC [gamma proteobacterium symbiont of Lucinoma myriamae]MCU7831472.1 crossover junction endodeoxyribonuclease RuvC [gamma proteobacterium symbiont of Lucinoma myriamae]